MQRKVTVCWDADNPVLGKWACTADDGAGGKRAWTVVIREEGGKLARSMTGDNGDLQTVTKRSHAGSPMKQVFGS